MVGLTYVDLLNAQLVTTTLTTYKVKSIQKKYLNYADFVKKNPKPLTTYSMNAHASSKHDLIFCTTNPLSTHLTGTLTI